MTGRNQARIPRSGRSVRPTCAFAVDPEVLDDGPGALGLSNQGGRARMARKGFDPRVSNPDGGSSIDPPGSVPIPAERQWPSRLRHASEQLQNPPDEASRTTALGQTWKILYASLSLYLRSHCSRFGAIAQEDLEDLAAEKALDLLRRIVSRKTAFADRSEGEIASFLSTVARNELLDWVKRDARRVLPKDEDQPEWDVGGIDQEAGMSTTDPPDVSVQRREFVDALRRCAEQLEPRSRSAWFFRVFYGMPSKDIAVHPELNLKASYVDVLLQRARRTVQDCMGRRGFDARDMPPGTFAELWSAFRLERE